MHDVTFEQLAQAPRFPHRIVVGLDVVGSDTVGLTIGGDGDTVQLRHYEVSAIVDAWEHRTGTASWNPTARLRSIVAHHPLKGFQAFNLADGPMCHARHSSAPWWILTRSVPMPRDTLRGVDPACGLQTPGHQLHERSSGGFERDRDRDLLEVRDVFEVGDTGVRLTLPGGPRLLRFDDVALPIATFRRQVATVLLSRSSVLCIPVA